MSDDTISRQAVIEALVKRTHLTWEYLKTIYPMLDVLEELPSAQTERPFEIQDILDYLDTALHPIVSPEHWNVYSELHDMISKLPSAERRGRWEHLGGDEWFCTACGYVITTEGSWERPWQKYCEECGAKMDDEER